jgi:hypothetical protein
VSTKCGRRGSPYRAFRRRFGRRSFDGVTSSELSLIAATGHDPPAGAHLLIVGVLIVGVVAALAAGRRRRDAAKDDGTPAEDAERERSEP